MSCYSLPWTLFSAYVVFELFTRGAIIRSVIREILLVFIHMEVGALKLVQLAIRPRYLLTGNCHKCGDCCRQLLADPPNFVKNTKLLEWFVGYHRLMHNFRVVARGPEEEIIFACDHLRDGRCSIYRRRPLLCRNYPMVPFYDPPMPLPNCGFGVAHRAVAAMQNRDSLPIVNPHVVVHHPTPPESDEAVPDHFHLLDPTGLDEDRGETS